MLNKQNGGPGGDSPPVKPTDGGDGGGGDGGVPTTLPIWSDPRGTVCRNQISRAGNPSLRFGSCTRCFRHLTRWGELLGRRRRCRCRRRRLLFYREAIAPRTPHPAYLARGRAIRMLDPIPECLVLQYSQIHGSYQNAWSFSISRFTGRKSSFEISKYTLFGICSKIRSSGPSHSIRLVKSVSKNQFSDNIIIKNDPKLKFHIKFDENRLN